jgi:hypothetical protein
MGLNAIGRTPDFRVAEASFPYVRDVFAFDACLIMEGLLIPPPLVVCLVEIRLISSDLLRHPLFVPNRCGSLSLGR